MIMSTFVCFHLGMCLCSFQLGNTERVTSDHHSICLFTASALLLQLPCYSPALPQLCLAATLSSLECCGMLPLSAGRHRSKTLPPANTGVCDHHTLLQLHVPHRYTSACPDCYTALGYVRYDFVTSRSPQLNRSGRSRLPSLSAEACDCHRTKVVFDLAARLVDLKARSQNW